MQILLYVIDVILFLALFITLEIVWANVKAGYAARDYLTCLRYILMGVAALAAIIAVSTLANNYLQ